MGRRRVDVTLIAAALVLSACGLFRPELDMAAPSFGLESALVVEFDRNAAIGVRRGDDGLELLRLRPDGAGWDADVIASTSTADGAATVQFAADEGQSSDPRVYLYGVAPPDATSVAVRITGTANDQDEPRITGGAVQDGLWLVVVFAADLAPADIGWEFMDARDRSVLAGTGVYP